jgi:hypothetical protein
MAQQLRVVCADYRHLLQPVECRWPLVAGGGGYLYIKQVAAVAVLWPVALQLRAHRQ